LFPKNPSKSEALCFRFVTSFSFNCEKLTHRQTSKLEDDPLSAVHDCFFNIFAATLHTWRPSPPSASRGRALPLWQKPTQHGA